MPDVVDRVGVTVEIGPEHEASREDVARRSLTEWLWWFAVRQPLGLAGAVIVLALVLTAIFAPALAPHGPKDAAFAAYVPPGAQFPMGTDHLGRDILSRVVWGARLSLYVGLASVLFGVTFGALWGVVTAYFGGISDTTSQRVVDSLMALPPIILALALMAAFGQSVTNVIIALAILLIPTAARTIRSVALSIKEMPYVEAAHAAGAGDQCLQIVADLSELGDEVALADHAPLAAPALARAVAQLLVAAHRRLRRLVLGLRL